MKPEEKKPRIRRTKHQLEHSIMEAMETLTTQKGFAALSLLEVAKEAKVEPQVIYNRYGGMDGLLAAFAKRYEYWLNDVSDKLQTKYENGHYQEFIVGLLQGIAEKLYKDRVMQQLLIWEVTERNFITDKSAVYRESNVRFICNYYEQLLKNSGISFNAISSIVTAGIYYLVLHKDASTFCTIDYNSKEGQEVLQQAIADLFKLIFDNSEQNNKLLDAAMKMKADGMTDELIEKYTGIKL